MQTIRSLNGVLVVRRGIAVLPSVLDRLKNRTAIVSFVKVEVRLGENLVAALVTEMASVRQIPEHALKLLLRLPLPKLVASLVGNHFEDVGTNIPSAKGGKIPVSRDGSNLRVVVIKVLVFSANQMFGNSITKKDTQNVVALSIAFVLIPGYQDEGVLHKVLVLKKGFKELAAPDTSNSDGRVMSIGGHVGGDEHPLRQLVCLEILVELGARRVNKRQVLDLRQLLLGVGDAVMQNGRVMLADIVIGAILLVNVRHTLESGEGHVLLIMAPRDALGIQEINDSRNVARRAGEVVVLHAKVVPSNRSHVVGLRGMGNGEIV